MKAILVCLMFFACDVMAGETGEILEGEMSLDQLSGYQKLQTYHLFYEEASSSSKESIACLDLHALTIDASDYRSAFHRSFLIFKGYLSIARVARKPFDFQEVVLSNYLDAYKTCKENNACETAVLSQFEKDISDHKQLQSSYSHYVEKGHQYLDYYYYDLENIYKTPMIPIDCEVKILQDIVI